MAHIAEKYPELNRRVTKREYDSYLRYALDMGIINAFIQDRKVAKEALSQTLMGKEFKVYFNL
jgi:putative pyruvate formate lyase activating enzyme